MEENIIRKAIKESGYVRQFLAKKAETSTTQLSLFMTGKRGLPKGAKEKLIEFLGLQKEGLNK